MPLRPGQTFYGTFTTQNPTTGAAANADSTPVGSAIHNGAVDSSVTITVANLATGVYSISGTTPTTYSAGDGLQVVVNVTITAITTNGVVASWQIDPNVASGTTAVTQDYNGTGNMTVQNSANQPLQGATVIAYLTSSYTSNPQTAIAQGQDTTDVDGNWTIWLVPGSYTIVASFMGDESAMATVTVT